MSLERVRSIDELQQEIGDAKLRLALAMLLDDKGDQIQKEISDDKALQIEAEESKERMRPRVYQAIYRELRKQNLGQQLRHSLPKVVNIAAAVVLVFFLSLSTALAVSSTVRVRVMKLIMTIEDEYTAFSLKEDEEASFDIPSEWLASYYPTYIPEGYELDSVLGTSDSSEASFKNEEGHVIGFYENSSYAKMHIDTEDAEVNVTLMQGKQVTVISKNGTTTFVWIEQNRYYVLQGEGTIEFLSQIMKGLARVN